jgi:nitrate/nitrite-specific signal transduction histidine kinase
MTFRETRHGGQLRRRYTIALGAVALFAVLAQLKIQHSIQQQEQDSRVINIAGRQRMLSQSLAKLALNIGTAEERSDLERHVREMRAVLDQWSSSHAALLRGDPGQGLPPTEDREIIDLYSRIEPHFERMHRAGVRLLETASDPDRRDPERSTWKREVDEILAHEAAFLEGMDDIVFAYDAQAKSKVALLRDTEIGLLLLILAVLLAVAFLIFEPTVRLIRSQFEQLDVAAAEREELIGELRDALAAVKRLRGLLPICASCKKIRNDDGYWTQIEAYIEEHSEALFTHGICEDCLERLYPEHRPQGPELRPAAGPRSTESIA